MEFTLPQLPYSYGDLEPHIDGRTMEIHHTKHHQAYIDKLNEALQKHPELSDKNLDQLLTDLEAIPEDIRGAVRNHGGGHYNHSLFWTIMAKEGGDMSTHLKENIDTAFGNFDSFKEQFSTAAKGVFGSGWAWLTVDANGKLSIESTPNQDTPIMQGRTPIMGLDVWEHAYYLNYQNRRPDYLEAWWNIVNWMEVSKRFASATNLASGQ